MNALHFVVGNGVAEVASSVLTMENKELWQVIIWEGIDEWCKSRHKEPEMATGTPEWRMCGSSRAEQNLYEARKSKCM